MCCKIFFLTFKETFLVIYEDIEIVKNHTVTIAILAECLTVILFQLNKQVLEQTDAMFYVGKREELTNSAALG